FAFKQEESKKKQETVAKTEEPATKKLKNIKGEQLLFKNNPFSKILSFSESIFLNLSFPLMTLKKYFNMVQHLL
ncbi:hypothetical protein BpHYR1_009245, partial [Brachionus plicatilis]